MTSTTSSEIPSHLSAADKRALNAALTALLRGPDKVRAEQIRDKIKEDGWFPAAASAAHICQRQSLGLRPWESPPCSCPRPNNSPQGRLLAKMLSFGLSRFDLDPARVLHMSKAS